VDAGDLSARGSPQHRDVWIRGARRTDYPFGVSLFGGITMDNLGGLAVLLSAAPCLVGLPTDRSRHSPQVLGP